MTHRLQELRRKEEDAYLKFHAAAAHLASARRAKDRAFDHWMVASRERLREELKHELKAS